MLARYIIGGVALATIGYGLKKACFSKYNNSFSDIKDWCRKTEKKADDFFTDLKDRFYNQSFNNKLSPIKVSDDLYIIKERFYDILIPNFLESFSKIKNLPEFNMEHFEKLQYRVKKEEVTNLPKGDINTILKKYTEQFIIAVLYTQTSLNDIDKLVLEEDDYQNYSTNIKDKIQNLYQIINELISLCYTDFIQDDNVSNKFTENLTSLETLLNKVVLKSNNSKRFFELLKDIKF